MPEFLTNTDEIQINKLTIEQPKDAFERQFKAEIEVTVEDRAEIQKYLKGLVDNKQLGRFLKVSACLLQLPGQPANEFMVQPTEQRWHELIEQYKFNLGMDKRQTERLDGQWFGTPDAAINVQTTHPLQAAKFLEATTDEYLDFYYSLLLSDMHYHDTVYSGHFKVLALKLLGKANYHFDLNKRTYDVLTELIATNRRVGNSETARARYTVAAKVLYPKWAAEDSLLTEEDWEAYANYFNSCRDNTTWANFAEMAYLMHLLSHPKLEIVGPRIVPSSSINVGSASTTPLPSRKEY
jgi:hypothetical protein